MSTDNTIVNEGVAAEPAVAPSQAPASIEEQAAMTFKLGYPEFAKLVDNMSMKQLKRVMKALAEAPLNEKKFIFNVESEGLAFKLGMALMNAKFTMFQSAIAEQMLKNREKEVAVSSEEANTVEVTKTDNKE